MNNKNNLGFVELVDQMGSATSIVNSARVSFGKRHHGKLRENDKKLIKYLHCVPRPFGLIQLHAQQF